MSTEQQHKKKTQQHKVLGVVLGAAVASGFGFAPALLSLRHVAPRAIQPHR